ncbi:MAG: nucleotidyltransferase domain-containing protein [Spirochaetota bacterium]
MEKIKRHLLQLEQKQKIYNVLRNELQYNSNVLFAYVHGTFLCNCPFNDIDVAIYVETIPDSVLQYELQMEYILMEAIGLYQVDVRILNKAPLVFKYGVIKNGMLLLSKDEEKRNCFKEETIRDYLDFLPYIKRYRKEVLCVTI